MSDPALYSDGLIEISASRVLFRHYGIFGGSRSVSVSDIEKIVARDTTFWTGKYRIHGTGNFKIWFPKDVCRASRDKILFAFLKGKWRIIGFTVEDSQKVIGIFQELGLLR
ncbi:MAG: hypothetical protein R6W75_09775 [Smithellaceae bacterium]